MGNIKPLSKEAKKFQNHKSPMKIKTIDGNKALSCAHRNQKRKGIVAASKNTKSEMIMPDNK